MSPLPSTHVIHPDFSQHHRPVATGTMTGVCDLLDPHQGPAPYPLPEDWTGLVPLAVNLPCRLQALTSAQTAVSASQPVNSRQYLVAVPVTIPPVTAGEGGTIVKVTTSDDPNLTGRLLRVIDVQHGTETFQRDLVCVDNLTENNP